VNRNFTPQDNFSFSNKFEKTFQIRSNRCKLREEQEEKTKHPRPHSKKITQPNFSFNVTSIFKNDIHEKNNQTTKPYRSLRRTNYKYSNIDNAKDIILAKNNDIMLKKNKKERFIPNRIKRLKIDHVKDLIPNYNTENNLRKRENIPVNPQKVPYNIILQGIKENQQFLYSL